MDCPLGEIKIKVACPTVKGNEGANYLLCLVCCLDGQQQKLELKARENGCSLESRHKGPFQTPPAQNIPPKLMIIPLLKVKMK